MEKDENKLTKTQVFNVIILDKSGSMNSIRDAAISGFNETLAGINKAQEQYADTQDHFVSLFTLLLIGLLFVVTFCRLIIPAGISKSRKAV